MDIPPSNLVMERESERARARARKHVWFAPETLAHLTVKTPWERDDLKLLSVAAVARALFARASRL